MFCVELPDFKTCGPFSHYCTYPDGASAVVSAHGSEFLLYSMKPADGEATVMGFKKESVFILFLHQCEACVPFSHSDVQMEHLQILKNSIE